MAMRSSSSPRRVYFRHGQPLTCFAGRYFGPKHDATSTITSDKEVRIEVLENKGGRAQVQVTQRVGNRPAVIETWTEKHLTFASRS